MIPAIPPTTVPKVEFDAALISFLAKKISKAKTPAMGPNDETGDSEKESDNPAHDRTDDAPFARAEPFCPERPADPVEEDGEQVKHPDEDQTLPGETGGLPAHREIEEEGSRQNQRRARQDGQERAEEAHHNEQNDHGPDRDRVNGFSGKEIQEVEEGGEERCHGSRVTVSGQKNRRGELSSLG